MIVTIVMLFRLEVRDGQRVRRPRGRRTAHVDLESRRRALSFRNDVHARRPQKSFAWIWPTVAHLT